MSGYYYTKSELYHHGILGQKWGKLNGPPYPLGTKDHSKAEQKAGWRKSLGGGRNEELYDRKQSKSNKTSKKAVEQANTKVAKEGGLTPEQKKMLIGSAIGAAVALGVGTAVYVHLKKGSLPINEDFSIDAGSVIQRMSPASETDLHDVFYAAVNDHDKERYQKTLPNHYMNPNGLFGPRIGAGAKEVYLKEINVNKKIDIAGHSTCNKIFDNLQKDLSFNLQLKRLQSKYKLRLNYDIDITTYEGFNQLATQNHDPDFKDVYDKFFGELKRLGYSGFLDVNDQKHSGYSAQAPVVLFNDSSVFNVAKSTLFASNAREAYDTAMKEFGGRVALEEYVKELASDNLELAKLGAYTVAGGAYIGAMGTSAAINYSRDKNSPPTTNKVAKKKRSKR